MPWEKKTGNPGRYNEAGEPRALKRHLDKSEKGALFLRQLFIIN